MVRRRLSAAERRLAVGTPDEGATLTDVVGTLTSCDSDALVVTTRTGERVTVARDDVVAAKEIPPTPGRRGRPHRAISMSDLQEHMNNGWLAEEGHWHGRWLLRASHGYTKRANSCLTLGGPARPLERMLDDVRAWYAERGLPALLQVPLPPGAKASDDHTVQHALTRGWQVTSPTLVMTAATSRVRDCAGREDPRAALEVSAELTCAWWRLADARARAHESAARGLLTRSREQLFVTAQEDGNTLAHARIAFTEGWGGLFDVATSPSHRRRGLASTVIAACTHEASTRDVHSLYLQVSADNDAATTLYERLGFTTHHTYVYVEAPSGEVTPI